MGKWIIVCVMLLPAHVYGQVDQLKCRWLTRFDIEIELDSLTVIPGSITIARPDSLQIEWRYNPTTGAIGIRTSDTVPDSIEVCYQTIPYRLQEVYFNRSMSEYLHDREYRDQPSEEDETFSASREELFPTDNIQKSGSLSRGISFGNTQNVALNSTLNLQLEGMLTDDLNIRASITDQNVPFQPEGNTAQIQDFDNVYLELYNERFSLRGGDILLTNKHSDFLRYYKNVQGGMASLRYDVGEKSEAETSLGISVAKGKFATVNLEVQEGVAGPYRIRIPNSNDFIIILANSEKVYLDGKLLVRGFDNDYVFDYNKAEIHFTSKVLITKFSRVRIDVEYSDRNYSRTILAGNHYQKVGRFNFFLNYYSEKDNPNRPLTFTLTDDDKELMRNVGDDLDQALTISAQNAEFNKDQILYRMIDTVDIDSMSFRIFQYTTDMAEELYRVSFNDVGQGNGNYVRTGANLNGRVYEWVSPVNGLPQGDHEPIARIPAPSRKDMITLGAGVDITDYEEIYTEFAFTKNDINLFSDLDKDDDKGNAMKIGYRTTARPISFLKGYKLNADLNYEYDNEYFTPIDRFRYIEYDRDWNYLPDVTRDQTNDNFLNASLMVEKDAMNKIGYHLVKRKRKDYVDGSQHIFDLNKKIGRIQVLSNAFLMNNDAADFHSTWKRADADVSYRSAILVPGYTFRLDRNAVKAAGSDSIINTAMNFIEHNFYIKSHDTLQTQFGITYTLREDRSPVDGGLSVSDRSKMAQFFIRSAFSANQDLNVLFTYRNNRNFMVAAGSENEETVITRIDWFGRFLKNHIRSDLSYAVGNGRELKREFVYIQAVTGEGTHTWRDDNGDGVQDLSEFYLAINPDEKNYIKIFVPTNEFVFAYENNYNHRLNFEMPRGWKEGGGLKQFLSKFSNATSLNVIKRITSANLLARFLPFYSRIPEEDILSVRETVRSRIFFNRANTGFSFDVGFVSSGNKQLLTNGFEDHSREEFSSNIRITLSRFYSLKIFGSQGYSWSSSDFLTGRNYKIGHYKIAPELSWQPNNNFRTSLQYIFTDKKNIFEASENENSRIQELMARLTYSKAIKHNVTCTMRFINIDFQGLENSPVGYELLDALRPGRNITWNIVAQKKIINGLQLSVNYEGRKSSGHSIVHIGRMQVTALF